MRLLLRGVAFTTGALLSILVIGILDDTFPWFWLPLLLGVAASTVVALQPWFRASRLGAEFCAALTAATTFTYCLSTRPVITRFGSVLPHLALFFGFIAFLGLTTLFGGRGLSQLKTKAMTSWLFIPIFAGCVVGYVSGGIGGANHMVRWLMALTHIPKDQAEQVVHIFRKTIHVCAYGVVGFSLFRAALAGRARNSTAIGFAMLMVLCIASFDEIRQTTAPNRTGSAWDVALDMTGASSFVFIAWLFLRRSKKGPHSTPKSASGMNPPANLG